MVDKVCKTRRCFRYYQKTAGGVLKHPPPASRVRVNKFYKTAIFDFLEDGFLIFNVKNDFLEKNVIKAVYRNKKNVQNVKELHNEYAIAKS